MKYLQSFYQLHKSESSKTRYDVLFSAGKSLFVESFEKGGELWFYLTCGAYTKTRIKSRDTKYNFNANQKVGRSTHLSKMYMINESWGYMDLAKNDKQLVLFTLQEDIGILKVMPTKHTISDLDLYIGLLSDKESKGYKDIMCELDKLSERALERQKTLIL